MCADTVLWNTKILDCLNRWIINILTTSRSWWSLLPLTLLHLLILFWLYVLFLFFILTNQNLLRHLIVDTNTLHGSVHPLLHQLLLRLQELHELAMLLLVQQLTLHRLLILRVQSGTLIGSLLLCVYAIKLFTVRDRRSVVVQYFLGSEVSVHSQVLASTRRRELRWLSRIEAQVLELLRIYGHFA